MCSFAYLSAKVNLSGTLKELKSEEFIIGGSVLIYPDTSSFGKKPLQGGYSNKYGFYSIPEIELNEFIVIAKAIGYETQVKKIRVDKDSSITLNFQLNEIGVATDEITVEANRNTEVNKTISSVEIDPNLIMKLPALGGEIDIFRSMQLLPGVQQSSELSSGLYIRGGSPDQNLILLDGVIVYNPSHLGGFFSTFNSDAIRDIKLIKGAFPAEYGGRLSSVVDLQMKEGTKEKFSGSGGVSLISSRLTLEGPIGDKASFMISGRRTYFDVLLALGGVEDSPDYYFYDYNAKVNYEIDDNNRIFASGMFARDVFDENVDDEFDGDGFNINWGNSTGNLRWMHIINSKLFTNFSLIYTNYSFRSNIADDGDFNSFETFSRIRDLTVKAEAEYFPNKNHKIKTGFEITNHNFRVGASSQVSDLDFDLINTDDIIAFDAAFFFQDEWQINERLSSNLGARLYYFNNGDYLNLEPRLSGFYELDDNSTLKGAFAVAHQYLHLIVRNDINLPTDIWFPSTENVKPGRSIQGVLGYERTFGKNKYLFSIEGYYKKMYNLYEYQDTAQFTFGIPLESQFTEGTGEAYGIELFLNKRLGDFTGWIGYTLAWTTRQFDDLNNGKTFFPRFDRRHDISVVLTYRLSKSWETGITWNYGTGQAFTVPNGVYFPMQLNNDFSWSDRTYTFTDRNAFRLPSFHKMDVNLSKDFSMFGLDSKFHLNIYNVYNRRNPFIWYIDETSEYNPQSGDYELTPEVKQVTLFPIIPTVGLSFKF